MNEMECIFQSDLARDVRAEFVEQVSYGVSVADATVHVVAQFRHALTDQAEGAVVILAIAALQLQHRALSQTFREAAIELLQEGAVARLQPGETLLIRQQRQALQDQLLQAFTNASVTRDDLDEVTE